ncbi:Mus7/MMS22 family-domain-containing protein [Madurella fahalii]|uniref:Mus7/MMS22 family-domain-containing protein n=1 Tax=Madurella fahalii TaxID=1157608 RepID=A0ABQ0G5P0_9PEZI
MKTWRELGEVPDSDDESVDYTELYDNGQCDRFSENDVGEPQVRAVPTTPAKTDIWSIPSSSPRHASPEPLTARKQTTPKSGEPAPSARSVGEEHGPGSLPATAVDDGPATPSKTHPDITENPILEDEIPTAYGRFTTSGSAASSPASLLSRTPTPPGSPYRQTRPSPSRAWGTPGESEDISRQVAVRLERSLRPRKPIQQHPYLLENAQYTTFMKSHGVKPIRVIPETQPARKTAEEEDSQEQEYQAEESQDPNGEGPTGSTEESAPIPFDDDEDELALSPSLPKTSSPGHLRASSQQTSANQTDATSVSDDDELPPLERLLPVSGKKRRILKRQGAQLLPATQRKRPRSVPGSSQGSSPRPTSAPPPSVWDLSSSPLGPQALYEPSQELGNMAESPVQERPHTPPASFRRPTSTADPLGNGTVDTPIVINEDSEGELSESNLTASFHSSDSDSDVIRQNSRRIRGVLPASWLRLDQTKEKPAARSVRRSPEPSPNRGTRRGVALPRQGSPRPSITAPLLLFEDSDESDDTSRRRQNEEENPVRTTPTPAVIGEYDGDSAMEDDAIDWMLPTRKRSGSLSTSRRVKKQKKSRTQSFFKGNSGQFSRQPKITQVLSRSKHAGASTSAKRNPTDHPRRTRDGSSAKRRSRKRATAPPLLSILDVVEPDAPRFVKIAARAVKRKANLGKASPSKKLISFATRSDNVDALSALRDWKSGKTRPRIAAPPPRQTEKSKSRPALWEITTNLALNPPPTRSRSTSSFPRKLTRQTSLDGFVTVDNNEESRVPRPPSTPGSRLQKPIEDRIPALRPAQLEADEREDRRRQLNSRKRTLDAFYRRTRRALGQSTDDVLEQEPLDKNFTLQEPGSRSQYVFNDAEEPLVTGKDRIGETKSRFRKRLRPRYLDLEAPQYARANDPLPAEVSVIDVQAHRSQDKLAGLGPYGTHYTQHFEIFPLDRGTFFHESTVIGRGAVRDAMERGLSDRIRQQRPPVSFSFDGQALRWGAWGDTTSSEFGILVDWVVEQLGSDATTEATTSRKAIDAADFVLEYILGSLSVHNDLEEKAFFSRCLEVFPGFTSRFESLDWTTASEGRKRTQLEVAARFTVAILAVHRLSLTSGGHPMQNMKMEELLKKLASITIGRLLDAGTDQLRALYGDLQRSSFRERGIRSDRVLANCWVVMMRALRSAAIPRGSFWDVTHSVMLSRGVGSGSDAQTFERLWQDMFTLLPLCEIDDSGVLVPGLRDADPMEGWTLPQQLLKPVFELYKSNPRQPPGFNDYCRALVARCHYLVQQWGWYKCTGIIGTIFDFFGSQNLAHLRNEEVYKSPQFLEELDGSPSLSIEPEDRCFHIFVKLLALAIQRLKQAGRNNDIKNLVARTLPNHNRQYLKEDTVHQHDLAALRNHHDLLCTLFWVSPPDLRPAVHLMEKLVVPGSAHKEACLINVRAWNQLARFVMSQGEGPAAFKPFSAWRNNVFNQVLDQYLSAASDIEQQFHALASELPGISKDMRDEMIAKNKATALDILHFSVKASLDVLQRAPTLETALGGLNTTQLQKVFTGLDFHSPGFDWSVLRVALDTLDHFLARIEDASEEQYSSGFSDNNDPHQLEEAVLLVNEHLAKDFFWMSRTILAISVEKSQGPHAQQTACAEKTVTLAAKIAARFYKNRVTQLSPYFASGKYGLFSDLPKNLSTSERKFLPLFVAVLAKNHVFDFKDIGTNALGLWILSITKPLRFLGYENYLAEVLQHERLPFLDRATVAVGIPPDYNSNIDFFACAIHYMRRTLRERGLSSAQPKQQRDEFGKILQLTMQKMKEDLALLRPHAAEHGSYMDFVRQVISLIKSHGVGICVVDPFFTQPSPDYSPPMQDPQLHAAGIVAYGVRLSERDVTAVPQLFHYLYNNFKIALGNDKMEQECRILGRAMAENAHVATFVLQFMLPAVVQASAQTVDCWALLEVYAVALGDLLLDTACIPRELAGEDVEHAAGVLNGLLAWFDALGGGGSESAVSLQQLHVMTLLASVAHALQPSLASYLSNEPDSAVPGLDAIDRLAALFVEMRSHLAELISRLGTDEPPSDEGAGVRVMDLLGGWSPATMGIGSGSGAAGRNARVQDFAKTVVLDVRRNWVVSVDCVMVRMAGSAGRGGTGAGGSGIPALASTQAAASSSQALQGTRYAPWTKGEVLRRLWVEVGKWTLRAGPGDVVVRGANSKRRARRGPVDGDELLF